jgi:hypothetical protein
MFEPSGSDNGLSAMSSQTYLVLTGGVTRSRSLDKPGSQPFLAGGSADFHTKELG